VTNQKIEQIFYLTQGNPIKQPIIPVFEWFWRKSFEIKNSFCSLQECIV
jgi:hypothetical protein